MKTVKKRVRTRKGLKEYTYLGCPLTRNRTPWCFRLCVPDGEGSGHCGRIAPHGFKGRIQSGIERHKKKLGVHFQKLENMYVSAPTNECCEAGIRVSEGEAEIVLSLQQKFLDAAGSVDTAICFKAMNDAASFAVNSLVTDCLISTSNFNICFARPRVSGELVARGRFMASSGGHYMAEAVLTDSKGEEIGRGNGAFVKNRVPLSPEIGYRSPAAPPRRR